MPGLDRTGPVGAVPMVDRSFGRCRMTVAPAPELNAPVQQANEGCENTMPQESVQNNQVFSRGRRGIPCGCGQGFGFKGSRRIQG